MNFMPHGHCYFWTPEVLIPMVAGEVMHIVAYYGLSGMLFYLCSRPMGNVSTWMPPFLFLFACFIFTCGLTHTFSLITIWYPIYHVEGFGMLLSGVVSMFTFAMTIVRRKDILAFLGAGKSSIFAGSLDHSKSTDCQKCIDVLKRSQDGR